MVRLITHNMLTCHVKNCTKDNFPLVFSDVSLEIRPTPDDSINLPFLRRFLPKLEYSALVSTARDLGFGEDKLPDRMPRSLIIGAEEDVAEEGEEMNISSEDEEAFLRQLWHVLMEVHVEQGIMNCRGCGHKYKIEAGIPNMLLAEHEVGR